MLVEIRTKAFREKTIFYNYDVSEVAKVCFNNSNGTCALLKENKEIDERRKICSPKDGCGAVIDTNKKANRRSEQKTADL